MGWKREARLRLSEWHYFCYGQQDASKCSQADLTLSAVHFSNGKSALKYLFFKINILTIVSS